MGVPSAGIYDGAVKYCGPTMVYPAGTAPIQRNEVRYEEQLEDHHSDSLTNFLSHSSRKSATHISVDNYFTKNE